MTPRSQQILEILDRCCDQFRFPALDNGYVYPAATRLALFGSPDDWALVIEVFGFSPREGHPSTGIYTFAGTLHHRSGREDYVSEEAHRQYLLNNPHNELRFVHPIDDGDWLAEDPPESVAAAATRVVLRGHPVALPPPQDYALHGITLEDPPTVRVYELCRYLAAVARDDVLATTGERRRGVGPDLPQLLQLEEWHHPDVIDDSQRPSGSATFQQLARVLETGDPRQYRPDREPNTHWSHWPDGGSL